MLKQFFKDLVKSQVEGSLISKEFEKKILRDMRKRANKDKRNFGGKFGVK